MRTFTDEANAYDFMKSTNQARKAAGNAHIVVMVDGPEDNEYTVMELVDAIAEGFCYRWAA